MSVKRGGTTTSQLALLSVPSVRPPYLLALLLDRLLVRALALDLEALAVLLRLLGRALGRPVGAVRRRLGEGRRGGWVDGGGVREVGARVVGWAPDIKCMRCAHR